MVDNGRAREFFRRPELFFSELLKKSARGVLRESTDYVQFLFRAVVVAVDVEGGKLENPDADGRLTHVVDGRSFDVPARAGPTNPRNSVKARILSDGYDQFVHDDRLRVFWPFMQEHVSAPIKPGEHVYVVFEDPGMEHGLWIAKVPGHENANYFKGESSYGAVGESSLASKFDDSRGSARESEDFDTDAAAGESRPDGRLTALFARSG